MSKLSLAGLVASVTNYLSSTTARVVLTTMAPSTHNEQPATTPGDPGLLAEAERAEDRDVYFRDRLPVRRAKGALCTGHTRKGRPCNAFRLPIGDGQHANFCKHHATTEELAAWAAYSGKTLTASANA